MPDRVPRKLLMFDVHGVNLAQATRPPFTIPLFLVGALVRLLVRFDTSEAVDFDAWFIVPVYA